MCLDAVVWVEVTKGFGEQGSEQSTSVSEAQRWLKDVIAKATVEKRELKKGLTAFRWNFPTRSNMN
jgi:hypothetical protein